MKLEALKTKATRMANRSLMQVKKYSPEILTGVAVVTGVAAVVTAIRSTLKAGDVLAEVDHMREQIAQVKAYKEAEVIDDEMYTDKDLQRDTVILAVKTGVKFMKLYAPTIAFEAISVASMLGAYSILKKRYMGAVAAYTASQALFEKYRETVREKEGDTYEKSIFEESSLKAEKVIESQEEEKDSSPRGGKRLGSIYARWFDEASRWWSKIPGENLIFLRRQQSYANDLLRLHGHLFLNEVYDMLDIPRTSAGSIVGWVWEEGKTVDFGMSDIFDHRIRDFLNGRERTVFLDFNVDGVIYDLI